MTLLPVGAAEGHVPASLCAVGPHFVIAPAGEPGANLHSALTALPAVREALVLLAAASDAASVLHAWLDDLARIAVERGASTLVLAASGLATLVAGTRPAERVAAAAGLPVIAPDGVVSVDPDGVLRVSGGDTVSWWQCAPHDVPRRLGPVWPPADAGGTGNSEGLTRPPGPAVTTIAAGCWVTADGCTPPAADIASVPEGTFLLGAGSPDHPDLTTAELAGALAKIGPLDTQSLTFAAPWSPPAELARMAAALSDLLSGDVRAAIGLPMQDSCMFVDVAGRPTWEPWLLELTASWRHRRVLPSAWRTGHPCSSSSADRPPEARIQAGALPATDAAVEHPASDLGQHARVLGATKGARLSVIRTLADWELEAIPAGLWLRPAEGPPTGGPRLRPPDQRHPLLIVGGEDHPVPEMVWEEFMRVLTDLRHSPQAPLGMLVAFPPDPADEAVARFIARMHHLEWLGREAPPVPARPTLTSTVPAPAGVPDPAPARLVTTQADGPVTASGPAGALPERTVSTGPADTDAYIPAGRPAPAIRSVPVPHRPATTEDRAALRALVGARFQRYAGRVDQVVARLPGLRATLDEDVRTDLVAVLLHHLDEGMPLSRAELVASARRGDTGSPAAFLHCLGSGLRHLPSHRGPVLLAAHAEAHDLTAYVPGQVLTEPAAISGVPALDADLAAPVELAVWSSTGRRTVLFGGPGDEQEVTFPPGTCFSVIGVMERTRARILLRETTGEDDPAGVRDRQAGERLLAWMEKRDALPPDRMRPLDRPERFHVGPGSE